MKCPSLGPLVDWAAGAEVLDMELAYVHSTKVKEKSRPEERAADAAKLEKHLKSVWDSLGAIPSFRGKAQFMDKVLKAYGEAQCLASELKADAAEKE